MEGVEKGAGYKIMHDGSVARRNGLGIIIAKYYRIRSLAFYGRVTS